MCIGMSSFFDFMCVPQGRSDEAPAPYTVGLLLAARGAAPRVLIELEPGAESVASRPWPAALELLRWLQSGEPRLIVSTRRLRRPR
jgi:hypothetical protein